MKIIVSNRIDTPIYEQIVNQIRENILTGELKPGEVLPSIRVLAKELQISVITTNRAYDDLVHEGYITSVQGKGTFILPQNAEMLRESYLKKIEEHLSEAVSLSRLVNVTNDELRTMLDLLSNSEEQ